MATPPTLTQGEPERFKAALEKANDLKSQYVDSLIRYYETNTFWPRLWFRSTGVGIILCSAVLPAAAAVAAEKFPYKDQVVAGLSIIVAVLSSLAAFYRWERTWRGNYTARIAIAQFSSKWTLELARAELSMKPEERITHVYQATDDLLTNVKAVIASESGTFFDGLKIPETDRTSKP